jgi:hypothetical protein
MVYVVERYLPGLCRADLLPGLSRLTPAIEELRKEGSEVRHLSSTIVLEDEACFCEFEGSSEAVAEANRRAGLPVDRIVPAVLVQSNERSNAMSVSTSIPGTSRLGRSRPFVWIAAVAVVVAVAAWAVASYVVVSRSPSARQSVATQTFVPASLTPQERQYVRSIAAMSYQQLAAAFGFDARAAALLASLPPRERRYVQSVSALTPRQVAAAFGSGR